MTKQEHSTSESVGNDAGARLSLLKSTLLSSASGSLSSKSEQLPGATGTNFTPLLSVASPEDTSNLGVNIFRGQSHTDHGVSGISSNEGEYIRGPTLMNNTSFNSSNTSPSSGDILVVNSSADSSTTSSVNQSLEEATQRKYFCKVCDQGFTRKHNMASHELIHSSSKPHVCRVCDSRFRRIHDLKRHEKLHTGEKPFHCSKCTRRFARPDALIRHQNSPNACSGSAHSVNRTGGAFFSQVVPTASASTSALPLSSANTDPTNRDSDMNRWKIYQQGVQNSPQYQTVYSSIQNLNNDTKITTTANTNNRSDNEQQGHQGNENYHILENREPYFSSQNSPTQLNPSYLPYYLPVSKNQPLQRNNPTLTLNNHSIQSSGQQQSHTGYVTMSKYQDLVTYTRSLQESLSNMDSRLRYLEGRSFNWLKEDAMSDKQEKTNNPGNILKQ